jgi:small subunit ribosomal protein S16
MVTVRLSRGGSKKRPFYHIVAASTSSPRDGKFLERLGFFNPLARGKAEKLRINVERIAYWKSCGARISDRVTSLVKQAGKMTPAVAAVPEATTTTTTTSTEEKA